MTQGCSRDEIVSLLSQLAFFGELAGANPFKIRAYRNAAEAIAHLSHSDFSERLTLHTLTDLDGIGRGVAGLISEFKNNGTVSELKELTHQFPETLFELNEVPGLGVKKIAALYKELGIAALSELEYACRENRISLLKGFGPKSQTKFLEAIEHLKSTRNLHTGPTAWEDWALIEEEIRRSKGVGTLWPTGALVRCDEVVDAIDLLLEIDSKKAAESLQKKHKRSPNGIPLRFHFLMPTDDADTVVSRVYSSATAPHFSALLACAETAGLALSPLKLMKGRSPVKLKTEEDLYRAVGAHPVPAELRDSADSVVPLSKPGPVPEDLVSESDLDGAFHNHTTESDGANSLEEMVEQARALKWKWIGISDHSQSAFYAQGLEPKRLEEQHEKILKLRLKYSDIRIVHGVESDILADGRLDYPDAVLEKLDFVIASVHSHMSQNSETMTERLCKALAHPKTTILGHPTGRLLLGRKGFQFDWQKILQTAEKHGKAIELNANPHRLDIDWRVLRSMKKSSKVKIAISPDAHSTLGMHDLKWGAGIARKGALSRSRILRPV